MVLVPEVRRALKPYGNIPILAAGGICTGEQMAGVMAMGADGVWCASVFLPTTEAETSDNVKEKMIAARDVLDRSGFVKTEKVEVSAANPLFILPEKVNEDE